MSLIEQLCGYTRAKSVIDNCPKNGMFYRDMDSVCDPLEILYYVWYGNSLLVFEENNGWVKSIYHTGCEYIADQLRDIDKLKSELLEYRREHGIYDVGDFIMFEGKLYEIKYIYHPEKARITDGFQGRNIHNFPRDIRHATDLEIKAGCRR